MQRTHAQLISECKKRGIFLEHLESMGAKHYSRQDLIDILAHNTVETMENPSWGLKERMKIVSPMLCYSYKHLKPEEKENVFNSPSWGAERKFNGVRLLAFYHPDEGFQFFSRNISVEDFLPVGYTDKVLLIKNNQVNVPANCLKMFAKPFILDCEVIVENKNVDTSQFSKYGVMTGSELNAVAAILAINPMASKQIQMEQAPLKFMVFDVLRVGDIETWKLPLRQRREYLKKMVEKLSATLPFELSALEIDNKRALYNKVLEEGGEGVVLKNLDAAYVPTTSRGRNVQVKVKRNMAETLGGDIDTYVIGFVESDETKSWKDYIGALKMAVLLRDRKGGEREHWVGTVPGLPLELRKQVSFIDPKTGKPALKPEYYGKVLAINGQDVSAKNLRFKHCTCDDWNFRIDKSQQDCVMDEEFLKSQVF